MGKAIFGVGPPKISQKPNTLKCVAKKLSSLSGLITLKKFFLLEMILEISLPKRLASSKSLGRETNILFYGFLSGFMT